MRCYREKLFARLGQRAYQSVVEATRLCRNWRHEFVELEHWLRSSLSYVEGDLHLLCRHYKLDTDRIIRDLDQILQTTPGRVNDVANLSGSLEDAIERGFLLSQLDDSGNDKVRSIHILISQLENNGHFRKLCRLSEEFRKLPLPEVFTQWPDVLAGSIEHTASSSQPALKQESTPLSGNDDVLTRWCSDLTALARAGQIDPVVGRDDELRQLLDVLMRRRQNNPILTGDAGVGKTAVVEALARLIVRGDVPPALKKARLLSLDLGRIQAGASPRGEFESRMKALMDAIHYSVDPVLLFCDEAHTLIGAGGQAGTGDAVNLLKPMLARGELRMIAATTWSEYKQFIEPDAALTRRFQTIAINEPDAEQAITMLRAVAEKFASHHQVHIRDSALKAAVMLSMKNLPERKLPDKAVSLLDTACARVALARHSEPASLTACRSSLLSLQLERESLLAECHFLLEPDPALGLLDIQIAETEEALTLHLAELSNTRNHALLQQAGHTLSPATSQTSQLIPAWVDESVIAQVLSDWTGIPSGRMLQNEVQTVLTLEASLGDAIYGQPLALQQIAQAVRISRSSLQNPERPLGVFMLTGPSGTGKTETARVLAKAMYGGEHSLITFNMSEFQEAHSVSTLKGAPPGYVGYGKGGRLTEAVRRNPWSVLLLDEFEKAHPDIHELFYQIFDRGEAEDGEGRRVSFRHCLILLTSNIGSEEIASAADKGLPLSLSAFRPIAHDALAKTFAPALLGRMTVVPYLPLSPSTLEQIALSKLHEIHQRLKQHHQVPLHVSGNVPLWLAERVATHPSKGRAIESLLQQALLPEMSRQLLEHQRDNVTVSAMHLDLIDDTLSLRTE